MTRITNTLGRTARRTAMFTTALLLGATGTAAAHSSGGYGGGVMGGGGWGLFGGAMGLWGLLWMGLLVAVPLYIVYSLLGRGGDRSDEGSLSVLRERYARGELSDDEFERRREQLRRAE